MSQPIAKRVASWALACCVSSLWLSAAHSADVLTTLSPVRGGEAPLEVTLDVSGLSAIELTATGYSWGQAVWGEATLIRSDGTKARLSDLTPLSFKVGWGQFTKNRGPDRNKLKVGGREFKHGLFAHADSSVILHLGGEFVRFHAWVGVNHTSKDQGAVVFSVLDAEQALRRRQFESIRATFTRDILDEARRVLGDAPSPRLDKFASDFDEIDSGLEAQSTDALAQAEEGAALIRDIHLSSFDAPLLFVKRHEYMAGHIYDDYLTYHPGGGIYIIEDPSAPEEARVVRPLIDPTTPETLGEGVYRDPEVSFDGKRVLFAFKGSADGDTSVYEIGIDGTRLKRLSDPGQACSTMEPQAGLKGTGHHDITPSYLAGDRVAFTSTRTGGHVMCFSSYIDTLHTMARDGSDVRCVSVNNQNEFDPVALPDGRVLYGRWEYVDKTALYMQSLWTVDPDGANESALFANNLAKPTAVLDARPVPNSRLIAASLTPHNGQAVGAVVMIDPTRGKNDLDAITNFTPEFPTEMDQGLKRGACDPWPLSEDVVLMANNDPRHGEHGVIELATRAGFRAVVHRDSEITCYSPMLIKPRPEPLSKPSSIVDGEPGAFLVTDVYQGLDGVAYGEVKWLRVIETTSRLSGIPPGGRWWNQAFLASWQGSYDIKNFLGVVPVEADGSAYFEAPVGKALYFQALDAQGRLIQSQRTFAQSLPGVTRSCVGCHVKDDDAAPPNRKPSIAARQKAPSQLRRESWGEGYIDYPTMVQPILDRRCVDCHGGEKGMRGGLDLSGGWTWAFSISYETLIRNTLVGFLRCHNNAVETAEILDPRTHGSGMAPLGELLQSGHKERLEGMTEREVDLLMAWMDGNCNYYGTWDYSPHATCESVIEAGRLLADEMRDAGCLKCHQNVVGADWINLQVPERSRILRAPLAEGDSGMGLAWCRDRKARKVDFPLITQKHQPPDVFRPARRAAPDDGGERVTPFTNTDAAYQSMLDVIRQARSQALKTPRVDMPGARITKGRIRDLSAMLYNR